MREYGILRPADILKRLDAKVVLLPIKRGGKATSVKNWPKMTFAKTQALTFQKRLSGGSAIAVSLGTASEGICSIDFDVEDAYDEFIELNPMLKASLTTKGERGCNIWLRLSGDFPRGKKLKRSGEPIGEWRSTGNYTIISGDHPSGCQYQVVVEGKPVEVKFKQVIWPDSWSPFGEGFGDEGAGAGVDPSFPSPPLSDDSESSEHSKFSKPSIYHNSPTLIERDLQAQAARKKLARNSDLSRLYERYLARIFTPKQGDRNISLITMTTFLFHTVGRTRLTELVTAYHQINYDIFVDSLSLHMTEANAHLKTLDTDYLANLSPAAIGIVKQLPPQHMDVFRICRDLAIVARPESPAGTFFISFNELACRLATSPSQAGRLLECLISLKVFEVMEKGQLYQKGRKPKATSYHWLLDKNESDK